VQTHQLGPSQTTSNQRLSQFSLSIACVSTLLVKFHAAVTLSSTKLLRDDQWLLPCGLLLLACTYAGWG
jgi:hypothetical protein